MNLKTSRVMSAVAVGFVCVSAASTCLAGSKVTLGRHVARSGQISMDRVDHGAWHALLQKYVDSNGNVDYTGWQRSASDMRALDEYLNMLSYAGPKIRATRAAQLAFWFNAYNAVTVKGILREYPTTSIRNHTAKVLGYNIWHDLLLDDPSPFSWWTSLGFGIRPKRRISQADVLPLASGNVMPSLCASSATGTPPPTIHVPPLKGCSMHGLNQNTKQIRMQQRPHS